MVHSHMTAISSSLHANSGTLQMAHPRWQKPVAFCWVIIMPIKKMPPSGREMPWQPTEHSVGAVKIDGCSLLPKHGERYSVTYRIALAYSITMVM